ncbi:MAG: heat shock protein Hsp20 family [Chloroflexi bacterium]|nr:heat shock protein Hsp20 family [Chloroflexota bacterium]
MAVIRWNPGSELMNLHSEMDRLFTELAEGLTPARMGRGGSGGAEMQAFLPIDIERTDDALVIRASVPGFKPEEVNVTVDQGVLTIDARHEEQRDRKDRNFLRQERFVGRLYRQILLGSEVNSEEARATFDNGVLTVIVPLAQRPQPRRIEVQPGEDTSAMGLEETPVESGSTASAPGGNGSGAATEAQGLEETPVAAGQQQQG